MFSLARTIAAVPPAAPRDQSSIIWPLAQLCLIRFDLDPPYLTSSAKSLKGSVSAFDSNLVQAQGQSRSCGRPVLPPWDVSTRGLSPIIGGWFRCWKCSNVFRLLHGPPNGEPQVQWGGRTAAAPPPSRFRPFPRPEGCCHAALSAQ